MSQLNFYVPDCTRRFLEGPFSPVYRSYGPVLIAKFEGTPANNLVFINGV
jgi:hypothetical protein